MSTAQSDVTLALAKKESAEHLGKEMDDLRADMLSRSVTVTAKLQDPSCASSASLSTGSKKMVKTKTVHFMRHGQGFHNLLADMRRSAGQNWTQFVNDPEKNPYVMPEVLDAPLTDKGRRQAMDARKEVTSFANPVELVVVSPLCRATQTGLIAFEHLIPTEQTALTAKKLFVAHEGAREESGVHLCDKRRPIREAKNEFPHVDYQFVTSDEDDIFSPTTRESKKEVGERIYQFLMFLKDRPESHIAVATHSGWLMTLFNGVVDCEGSLREWFNTGELKSVEMSWLEWRI